jgi:hypothetical protein
MQITSVHTRFLLLASVMFNLCLGIYVAGRPGINSYIWFLGVATAILSIVGLVALLRSDRLSTARLFLFSPRLTAKSRGGFFFIIALIGIVNLALIYLLNSTLSFSTDTEQFLMSWPYIVGHLGILGSTATINHRCSHCGYVFRIFERVPGIGDRCYSCSAIFKQIVTYEK